VARLARLVVRVEAGVTVIKMFTVYILKSESANKSYVGMTDNLDRRFREHNSGRHLYTKRYLPWRLIHSEEFDAREDARKREKYFKSASGRRYMKRLFEEYD